MTLSVLEDLVLRAVIAIEADSGYAPSFAEIVYYVSVQGEARDSDTINDALTELIGHGCVAQSLESNGRRTYRATDDGRRRLGNCA